MNKDADRTLQMERVISAPVAEVFDAFVIPEQLASWWGPEGVTIPDYSMDVRPGGKWRTVMLLPDGTRPEVSGVYRAIEKNRRLVFTWAWKQDDGSRGHETEITGHLRSLQRKHAGYAGPIALRRNGTSRPPCTGLELEF